MNKSGTKKPLIKNEKNLTLNNKKINPLKSDLLNPQNNIVEIRNLLIMLTRFIYEIL